MDAPAPEADLLFALFGRIVGPDFFDQLRSEAERKATRLLYLVGSDLVDDVAAARERREYGTRVDGVTVF